MIYPIRYFGDPILRQVARPVTRFDANLVALADDMFQTMFDANGIGLAATQIGIPRQIFVAVEVDPAFEDEEEDAPADRAPVGTAEAGLGAAPPAGAGGATARDPLALGESALARGVIAKHVLINPEITVQDGVQHGPDGCLSLPGLYVDEVRRFLRVRLRYQDLNGQRHELDAQGRFAHVLQHEFDHLHGVLFFDRLPAAERQAFLEANRRELAEMQRQAKALLKELRRAPVPVTVG